MKPIIKQLEFLFIASLAGDKQSYRLFLTQIAPLLRQIISRKISGSDAEDVLQEVLISIDKSKHTHDGLRPLMPWINAIVAFRINDQLRKNYSNMRYNHVDIAELENILSDVTESPIQTEYINELLNSVAERERKIISLMHIQGFNAKEVANKLNMKESAVKVAAHRAFKKIREQFNNG
jgi:RNA polymerase sigma-70 factor, ECF subfamily